MQKYTRVYSKTLAEDKIRTLDDSGFRLLVTMMSAPSSNMIGFYSYPVGYALYDLYSWDVDKLRTYARVLADAGIAYYDLRANVAFVTEYMLHNALESVKQITGGAALIRDIPATPLFPLFVAAWERHVLTRYKLSMPSRRAKAKDDRARAQTEASFGDVVRISEELRAFADSIAIPYSLDEMFQNTGATNEIASDTLSIPYPPERIAADTLSHQKQYQNTETVTEDRIQKQKQQQSADHNSGGCDHSSLITSIQDLWQEILVPVGLPRIEQFTDARRAALLARVNDDAKRSSADWWRELFIRIAERTYFPRAIAEKRGQWITFEWIMAEANFVALVEGKYDGEKAHISKGPQRTQRTPSEILSDFMGQGSPSAKYIGSVVDVTESKEVLIDDRELARLGEVSGSIESE